MDIPSLTFSIFGDYSGGVSQLEGFGIAELILTIKYEEKTLRFSLLTCPVVKGIPQEKIIVSSKNYFLGLNSDSSSTSILIYLIFIPETFSPCLPGFGNTVLNSFDVIDPEGSSERETFSK